MSTNAYDFEESKIWIRTKVFGLKITTHDQTRFSLLVKSLHSVMHGRPSKNRNCSFTLHYNISLIPKTMLPL